MNELQALTEALAFVDGQGGAAPADPEAQAVMLIEQLAERGFAIRSLSGMLADETSSAALSAARRALNLTVRDLARLARMDVRTISRAERPDGRPQPATIRAIVAVLKQLRAAQRSPENDRSQKDIETGRAQRRRRPEPGLSGASARQQGRDDRAKPDNES